MHVLTHAGVRLVVHATVRVVMVMLIIVVIVVVTLSSNQLAFYASNNAQCPRLQASAAEGLISGTVLPLHLAMAATCALLPLLPR